LGGGAAWEIAHKDTTTNKGTLARRAYKRQRGLSWFIFFKK